MRRGALLVLVVVAAAVGAASARADGTSTSTTTATTTGTTTTGTPAYAPLPGVRLGPDCVGAGAAAIYVHGRRVLAFGTPASTLAASAYPTDAPIIAFGSSTASGSTCHGTHVTLSSVSLFGGAVTASSVQATDGKGSVAGLEIEGAPVDATSGQTVLVGDWGELTLGAQVGRLAAPLVLRILRKHDSLAAGTAVAVAFSAISLPPPHPAAARKHASSARKQPQAGHSSKQKHRRGARRHRHAKTRVPQPLKWTPRLGVPWRHFDFPVDGGASYVDTYGANRSDIYDGWHHGDDLFAPIGTPVVAVVKGTLSLVGWNKLGGWRLWLTDKAGNSYYYAHLAGYSRWILTHRHVRAGQVIGFLGRTGDAFTTTPHLHFEVHPHQLLKLQYDGAVDPTRYLQKWKVVDVPKKEIPRPARLVAPRGTPAQEAAVVWHELLVARHLLPVRRVTLPAALRRPFPGPPTGSLLELPRRIAGVQLAAARGRAGGAPWPAVASALGLVAFGLGLVGVRRRSRRRAQP